MPNMAVTIVYIDDEAELCETFSDIFSSNEVRIITYVDPKAALKEVPLLKPDLAFFDYRIPHTSGDLLAQELKLSCPTFLISGESPTGLKHPFKKIFEKPYKPDEIQREITAVLALKK